MDWPATLLPQRPREKGNQVRGTEPVNIVHKKEQSGFLLGEKYTGNEPSQNGNRTTRFPRRPGKHLLNHKRQKGVRKKRKNSVRKEVGGSLGGKNNERIQKKILAVEERAQTMQSSQRGMSLFCWNQRKLPLSTQGLWVDLREGFRVGGRRVKRYACALSLKEEKEQNRGPITRVGNGAFFGGTRKPAVSKIGEGKKEYLDKNTDSWEPIFWKGGIGSRSLRLRRNSRAQKARDVRMRFGVRVGEDEKKYNIRGKRKKSKPQKKQWLERR